LSLADLPALDAVLNAASALLVLVGWGQIRAGRRQAHRAVMLAAVACSTAFLASYLYYHAHVGTVRFRGTGGLRTAYLGILLTHTVLAAAIVPLVGTTLALALRARWTRHRRLARVTLPIWTYVSVTGVVIYWMLYRL
jgi:uncharacterized membrane protein YozB (DUF420 family)